MEDLRKKLKTIYLLISSSKFEAVFVLIVSLLAAITESIGLSLVMPFLSFVIGEELHGAIGAFLNPILKALPSENLLVSLCFLLFAIILIKTLLMLYYTYLSNNFAWKLGESWRNMLMERYLNASFSYFVKQKQGVLLNNLLAEPDYAINALKALIEFITTLILCVVLYVTLLFINWKITLAISLLAGFAWLLSAGLTKRFASKLGNARIKLSQKRHFIATESISGFQLVKAFSLQRLRQKAFRQVTSRLLKLRLKIQIANCIPTAVGEIFIILLFIFLLYVLTSFDKIKLQTMLPLFGTVLLISQRLFCHLSSLVTQKIKIYYHMPSLYLINELSKQEIEPEDINSGLVFDRLHEDIRFKHVYYSYDSGKPALEDLNLTIPKGKVTAIIGASGAGKSTIADLLMGLLKPFKGEIRVNDKALQDYNLKSWRAKLGYVSQDTIIFHTSIRENIYMGKLDANDKDIENAAKQAAIHNFITSLPNGYDTEVGDRGVKLSGGQRQRIAIARAILREPDVYIFDEATSALDNKSEKLIQTSIKELGKKKTVVIISHRLSTIENADLVYDLNKLQRSFAPEYS